MQPQTELKSARRGSRLRPSNKSTVLFALATFFLVIHVVKCSAIREEEESADDNRFSQSNGELSCIVESLPLIESESCDRFRCLS